MKQRSKTKAKKRYKVTAISMPPELQTKAVCRARELRRGFSNYVRVLIERDLETETQEKAGREGVAR